MVELTVNELAAVPAYSQTLPAGAHQPESQALQASWTAILSLPQPATQCHDHSGYLSLETVGHRNKDASQ